MRDRSTISEDYLKLQQQLHEVPSYGIASLTYAPLVKQVLDQSGIRSISDYGAGKCNLRKGLHDLGKSDFEYYPYDPAFPDYGPPRPALLSCCIDVLEHIEESYLDHVLLDLEEITQSLGFFTVTSTPALKTLPDGRNAHLIQKPARWWLPRLCDHFDIRHLQYMPGVESFWVLVARKKG
jgi:hypothetical protein